MKYILTITVVLIIVAVFLTVEEYERIEANWFGGSVEQPTFVMNNEDIGIEHHSDGSGLVSGGTVEQCGETPDGRWIVHSFDCGHPMPQLSFGEPMPGFYEDEPPSKVKLITDYTEEDKPSIEFGEANTGIAQLSDSTYSFIVKGEIIATIKIDSMPQIEKILILDGEIGMIVTTVDCEVYIFIQQEDGSWIRKE